MLLEALTSLKLKLPEGLKTLQSGERITLPEEKAQKLLRLAKGKVRIVNESSHLHPGVWVEFDSPLFGLCTAKIHHMTLEGCIITNHSVLKGEGEPVTIPAAWVRGVYREEVAS